MQNLRWHDMSKTWHVMTCQRDMSWHVMNFLWHVTNFGVCSSLETNVACKERVIFFRQRKRLPFLWYSSVTRFFCVWTNKYEARGSALIGQLHILAELFYMSWHVKKRDMSWKVWHVKTRDMSRKWHVKSQYVKNRLTCHGFDMSDMSSEPHDMSYAH